MAVFDEIRSLMLEILECAQKALIILGVVAAISNWVCFTTVH